MKNERPAKFYSIPFFVSAEEAGRHYDEAMKRNPDAANVELNRCTEHTPNSPVSN